MPVVLTDRKNKVWCMEQPDDGLLHVGFIGKAGPKLEDILEFIQEKDTQFQKFLGKKERALSGHTLQRTKTKRDYRIRKTEGNSGSNTSGG